MSLSYNLCSNVLNSAVRNSRYISNKMILAQPKRETLKLVQKKLNDNIETEQHYIVLIKEWLRKEPHLPDEFDDQRILIFLRSCKFSLERCKKKMDVFFTVRSAYPEFFTDRDINRPEIREIAKAFYLFPLPRVTSEGCRLLMLRCKDTNIKNVNIVTAFKLIFMIGDIRLKEESVLEDIYVLDFFATHPRYVKTLTPTLFKKILVCVLEAYPVKVKAVHMINVWPWLRLIIDSLKPFIKEKIRNRLFFHYDTNEFYKHVPQELLPEEYGGQVGSANDIQAAWIKTVEDHTSWFKEEEKFKANESLRRDKSASYDEVFGIPGSFRQLSID